MLFDESGAVLLIRFLWRCGRMESLSSGSCRAEKLNRVSRRSAAAVRELREELGIAVTVEGPVYRDANQFWHQGEMQDNVDFLFRARCGRDEPRLAGLTAEEIAMMREMRWWTAEEIERALIKQPPERIFPVELAARVREQLALDG